MKKLGLTFSVLMIFTAFANAKDIVVLTDVKTGVQQVYTGVALKEIKAEDFKDATKRDAILKSVQESVKTGELAKEVKTQKQTLDEVKETFAKAPESADEELSNVRDQAKSAVVLVQPEVKEAIAPASTATPASADEELASKKPNSSYYVYGYGYVSYNYNPYVYGYGGYYGGYAVGVYRPYYSGFYNPYYSPYAYGGYYPNVYYPRHYGYGFRRW